MVSAILEGTLIVLILGLILANAENFSIAVRAVGQLYTSSVQTLSGVARSA